MIERWISIMQIPMGDKNDDGYVYQICFVMTDNIYYRQCINGNWGSWLKIIFEIM